MNVPMGPPPPRNPNPCANSEIFESDQTLVEVAEENSGHDGATLVPADACTPAAGAAAKPEKEDMERPAPAPVPTSDSDSASSSGLPRLNLAVPYSIPPWSKPPEHPFFFEVLKDGTIIEELDVSKKGVYMFGRIDLCDFVLEHPTISRFHAVLQFKKDEVFLYDLGSTHGTFINKIQVNKKAYKEVHVGDVIRFGLSSRLHIFQGPTDLMPAEGDLQKSRSAKIRQEMLDREASLLRARVDAALADGISWGMSEDATEEATENGTDEITWQTYTGQLTERQEKTRGKIIKRMEKVANMRKEIDSIRAKDIAQGGLTQGQQTQIARNEQRISQIMEELDSLEETLNESIQESIGARGGKLVHGRKKRNMEDEDDMLSDDDDFYDRTKKPPAPKSAEQKSVETAETLLDKKEAIVCQMEEKRALLLKEHEKEVPEIDKIMDGGDDLDAYMADLSSQLVHDRIARVQNELSELQTELDKVMYLLKIADPMGEATRKREIKSKSPTSRPISDISGPPTERKYGTCTIQATIAKSENASSCTQAVQRTIEGPDVNEDKNFKVSEYILKKPQWLGATRETEPEEKMKPEVHLDEKELDNFVGYKDRNKVLALIDDRQGIEQAAPGLIIRKRKSVQESGVTADKAPRLEASSSDAESSAVDAVVLLLKHKRGYSSLDEEHDENNQSGSKGQEGKEITQPKRVFGPSRPSFLDEYQEYESWLPPEGQTGDGRTSLNDRLGY